ncbi:MAG: isoprenylcysteine carboxylmethyltransferase family protein [Zoogloeaceae bacterium]|jgi:protein-S-isoprenylcysteine O-methyltransferase Ste14|nr:isoprenylcysteine carboxylmethyltransferase family protein [Zoogloeaceae bacterium]
MSVLELRVPPPLVALCAAALMWLAAWLPKTAALTFALPWRIPVAVALIIAGIAIALAGMAAFRKARTTINPLKPHTASAIVTSGVYQWSRNPMYAGVLLALTGWGVYLSNPVSALALPLFVAYLNRFQIKPEERALTTKFGAEYTAYTQRVRRWL